MESKLENSLGNKIFLFLIVALFAYVTSPLLSALGMGAVLAILMQPLHDLLLKRRIPRVLSAAFVSFGMTVLFLVPVTILLFFVAKSGLQSVEQWRNTLAASGSGPGSLFETFLARSWIKSLIEWITSSFPVSMPQLIEAGEDLVRSVGLKLAALFGEVVRLLPNMGLTLLVIVVSMFFFLLDGTKVLGWIRHHSTFSAKHTEMLIKTLGGVCRHVMLASGVAGASQAIFETVVCLVLGIPNAFMVGGLVFVGSFVPVVGSLPVTLGVVGYAFAVGNHTAGIVLLVAAGIVSSMDNFIRPLFLKGTSNLHPLLAFVAAFGGFQTLGALGIFFGPIIAAMFLAALQMLLVPSSERK